MAKIIYIPNKFAEERYEHTTKEKSLLGAVESFVAEYKEHKKAICGKKSTVFLNGERLHRDDWASCILKKKDIVEITHTVEGGWDFWDWFGFLMFGPLWWLMEDLLMVDEVETEQESPTYSWKGPATSTQQNVPVAVVYGEHLLGGQYINFNIESDGKENYLNALLALCEGPITGVRNEDNDDIAAFPTNLEVTTTKEPYIKINDTFISLFDKSYWAGRYGTNTQTSIRGFKDLRTSRNYSHPLPSLRGGEGDKWTVALTTLGDVDGMIHKYVAPQGIYRQYDSGKKKNNSVWWRMRYRVSPAGAWAYDPPLYGGSHDSKHSWFRTSMHKKGAVHWNTTTWFPARDTYDIQLQRYAPAQNELSSKKQSMSITNSNDVVEIVGENLAYPNTVVLAVKILATDQLSGSFPNITTLIHGRKVRVPDVGGDDFQDQYWTGGNNFTDGLWDGVSYATEYCNNPAYVLRDFLIDENYGFGEVITEDMIDDATFDAAAKKCWEKKGDEHANEINLVIDSRHQPGSIFEKIATIGRLIVFWSGGYVKCLYEEDTDPVQLITMGNILQDKFQISYTRQSELPNVIEVTFADKDDEYKQNAIEVVDEIEWSLNNPKRKRSVRFEGATSRTQVLREAQILINKARLSRTNIKFESTMGSIHCEPGDIIAVQHDVPQWGWGGRVVSGTSITFDIDQPMPQNIIDSPGSYTVQLIHSDDTIETVGVSGVSGKTISISGSFDTIPEEDEIYMVGILDSSIKEYRVKEVRYTKRFTVSISGTEHTSAMYDTTGLIVSDDGGGELPNPAAFAQPVTDLLVYELNTDLGIGIAFRQPEEDYAWARADIYISDDNNDFVKIGEGYGDDDIIYYNVRPGQQYYIRVYSINKQGIKNRDPVNDVITVKGDTVGNPQSPTGLEIYNQGNNTVFSGRDCKLAWRINAPYGGAGSLGPELPAGIGGQTWAIVRDFKIEIWDASSSTRLREEYTTDKFFIYTWEKNTEDNNGNPVRSFNIKVYQRNWFAKLSEQPAALTVSNPAPTMANTTPSLTNAFDGLFVDWSTYTTTDTDLASYKVYYGTATPLTASVAQISKSSKVTALSGLSTANLYYVQVEPYDLFGVGVKSQVASGIPRELINVDIGASIIAASNLAASCVTKESLRTDIIGPEYIEASAIEIEHLRTNIIDTNYIIASAIGTVHLKAGLIETNYIAASAITTDLLKSRLITTEYIAASAVETDNLKANIIKAAYIDGTDFGTLTLSSGKIIVNAPEGIDVNTASGIVVASGGGIEIQDGGDIAMSGTGGNPSTVSVGTGDQGTVFVQGVDTGIYQGLQIFPEFDNAANFYIGKPRGFTNVSVNSSEWLSLKSQYGNGNYAHCIIRSSYWGSSTYITLAVNNAGIQIDADDVSYGPRIETHGDLYPQNDSRDILGSINRCWANFYRDASQTCSDKKYKENIKAEVLGLDFVNALQPVEFTWNENKPASKERWGGKKFRGILAQDVEAVLDEVGYEASTFAGVVRHKQRDKDNNITGVWDYSFNYEQLISPMIKAIQELNKKVEKLEKE